MLKLFPDRNNFLKKFPFLVIFKIETNLFFVFQNTFSSSRVPRTLEESTGALGWDLWPRESKLGDLAFFLDCMRKGLWQSLFSSSSLELFPLFFLTKKPLTNKLNYSFSYLRSGSDHYTLFFQKHTTFQYRCSHTAPPKTQKNYSQKFFPKKPKSVCPLQRICRLISANQIHHKHTNQNNKPGLN